MLVEMNGCVYLESEMLVAHGHEDLDAVGREAFVNHVHISGSDHETKSTRLVERIVSELKRGWPGRMFRVYSEIRPDESIVRFHMVREAMPNWCDATIEGLVIMDIRT